MVSFTSQKPLTAADEFTPDGFLIITAGTYQKRSFIGPPDNKRMLLESLDFNCYKWQWRIAAHVILDNHYHLVLQTPSGDRSRLAQILQSAHSFSAHHWRKSDPSIRSRIWWNYWEGKLESLQSLRAHVCYLHDNPRRHGYTDQPESYEFSSYPHYLKSDLETIRQWERDTPADSVELIDNF